MFFLFPGATRIRKAYRNMKINVYIVRISQEQGVI